MLSEVDEPLDALLCEEETAVDDEASVDGVSCGESPDDELADEVSSVESDTRLPEWVVQTGA